jgi:hypothetical protein
VRYRQGAAVREAHLFTAALGWSNAIFAYAYPDETAPSGLDGQHRAYAAEQRRERRAVCEWVRQQPASRSRVAVHSSMVARYAGGDCRGRAFAGVDQDQSGGRWQRFGAPRHRGCGWLSTSQARPRLRIRVNSGIALMSLCLPCRHLLRFMIVALGLLAPGRSSAGIEVREIDAASTDPAIDVPGIGLHYVALDSTRPASHLLLFFPGTTASPAMYATLLRRAAELGHRVIGLSYLNRESVNFDYCPDQLNTGCHKDVRIEILTGEDRSPLLSVTRANSAYYRVVALLRHLDRSYPQEGWSRFLDGEEPRWERLIVSGQSQGGGHAALTAKLHEVARAVLLSATEPAPWTLDPSATPASRYFGLVHMLEPIQPPIIRSWNNLGLPGTLVDVDQQVPPYGDSQRLSASRIDCSGDPATSGFYHNCTSVEGWMPPPDANGTPAYQSAWDYLYALPTTTEGSSPVFVAGRIGDVSNSYIDPEAYAAERLLTFQDQTGGIHVAAIDQATGAFASSDGRESRLDSGAWPVGETFNGPEFGIDANGWAIYYTKANGGVASLWRATTAGAQPLTSGNRRQTVLASKDASAAQTRLLYIRGTLDAGELAWMDEDDASSETLLGPVDGGVRWIDGTRSFARIVDTGPDAGQVALVDTVAGSVRTITDDAGSKSFAVGFRGPESGRLRLLALVDAATAIGVWEDRGGAYYERIATIVPAGLAGHTLGSPEPFAGAGSSYVSFVVREGAGLPGEPAQVWLARTDGSNSWRCDDGASGVSRSDPETLVLGSRVFVYYNVITPSQYQLYRCGSSLPGANLAGTWWNEQSPGWGVHVTEQGTRVVLTLYSYDGLGRPAWYISDGAELQGDGSYLGTLYRFTGTPFDQIAGPAADAGQAVGSLRLSPQAHDTLNFLANVDGMTESRMLTRLSFGTRPTCVSTLGDAVSATNHTELWWNPDESGWGVGISEQGDTLFIAWYTYASNRTPMWIAGTLARQADGSFAGALHRPVSGTPLGQGDGPVTAFPVPQVGQARLHFIDGNHADFDYTLDGIAQTRVIERFVYGSPVTRCTR